MRVPREKLLIPCTGALCPVFVPRLIDGTEAYISISYTYLCKSSLTL